VKWLYWIGGLLLAGYLGLIWRSEPSWHRYRLTLAVETPEGPQQASGVLQSTLSSVYTPLLRGKCELRGEALFLDLPGGRNLVMLLAHGITADNTDLMCSLPFAALLDNTDRSKGPTPRAVFHDSWPRRLEGSVALPLELIPTLVTFRDLDNPASAQVIRAQGLSAFGPGFALKEVRLEMVDAGFWLFNLLSIPAPQALSGTPITTGIEGKLPVILSKTRELDKTLQLVHPNDPLKVRTGHLLAR
jgi:hypothetical protein